jgi:hypothetical protein
MLAHMLQASSLLSFLACAVSHHEEKLQKLLVKEDAVLSELSNPFCTTPECQPQHCLPFLHPAEKLRRQASSIEALRSAAEQQEQTIRQQASQLEETACSITKR